MLMLVTLKLYHYADISYIETDITMLMLITFIHNYADVSYIETI